TKMRILLFIWILHFMNLAESLNNTKSTSPVSRLCPAGCASCSALNGCLFCKPRLFFHLEMDGMRQRGTCLSSCPRGHYGTRSPHVSTCTRCREDCAFCFSENFCTHCYPGHFLFQGKCENSCPHGLTANAALRECTGETLTTACYSRTAVVYLYFLHGQCHLVCPSGFEPDVQLMQCIPKVHCEVGDWTDWGPCVRKRSIRAYRRGKETRTRQILQPPSVYGDPCPQMSQFRKCVKKKTTPLQHHLVLPGFFMNSTHRPTVN
uniref:R-spondin 3 n=1 Tax=Mastacembelus armatus TaxID=205130 RepID=A0A3Q3MHU4_9TELE